MTEVMVILRDSLFSDGNNLQGRHFVGFQPCDQKKVGKEPRTRIFAFWHLMEREVAERNPKYKQPIAYSAVLSCDGRVFAYQRSERDAAYPEKRLQGKWSWGLGGHMTRADISTPLDFISASIKRELMEELGLTSYDYESPRLLGYINLEEDVHQVHFGLLYVVQSSVNFIKPVDPEISRGEFRTIKEIEAMLFSGYDVEEWSKIVFEPLKKFLNAKV